MLRGATIRSHEDVSPKSPGVRRSPPANKFSRIVPLGVNFPKKPAELPF